MLRTALAFGATLAGFTSNGLAAGSANHVESLYERRTAQVVLQQSDLSCGAAALATILRYQHGETVTEREVALGLVSRKEYLARPDLVRFRGGFSLLDLKRYTDRLGYRGAAYGGMDMSDLAESVPIIVPISANGYNHFVVVRGIVGDTVILADPAYGNRTMPVQRFRKAWIKYAEIGKVGFIVKRRDGLIPPNRMAVRPQGL